MLNIKDVDGKYKVENKEKVDWIANGAWVIKKIIDKGLLKGFDKEDYQVIKTINITYNKAREEKSFDLYMIGDQLADRVSNKAFKLLQEIYENNKLLLNK